MKRNVVFVFVSSVGASGLSLLTVPIYLHLIGPARYGVLAFVWLIIGYFGLFILGLDKAITNLLARHRHDPVSARSLFQTAMLLNLVTSCVGGLILYFAGYQLLAHQLNATDEVLGAMPWIAASVPLATTTSLLIGALEAYERFPTLASTQFTGTLLFQVVPLGVAWFISPELHWVLPAAILSRAAATLWMAILLWPILRFGGRMAIERRWVPELLRYGSAIGISGVVSPILTSLDRLLIGGTLGATAMSYYVVPSNLINAVQILPGSFLRVLFPQLSILPENQARSAAAEATVGLAAILTPVIVCGILLANAFMTLWLGSAFVGHARGIAEILLYGAWINCLAWVPLSFLQSQGRPGWVARLHLMELVPFVAVVWAGVRFGGVTGAALACSLRMWVDAILMLQTSGLLRPLFRVLLQPAALVTSALLASLFLPPLSPAYIVLGTVIGGMSVLWSIVQLPPEQKQRLRKWSRAI